MWKRRLRKLRRLISFLAILDQVFDALVEQGYRYRCEQSKNPLNKFGMKSFSQGDEDGITLEICRRLGLTRGVFCEYGVGDGLECNTLMLAALGWKGFWISGQKLAFGTDGIDPNFFRFYEEWVTSSNVHFLYKRACDEMNIENVDVLSFDLDGNDLYFLGTLLEKSVRPKLFIVEYNAKFPPPARWSIAADDGFAWNETDYFGASLQSFTDLFHRHGYMLVCCNSHTGANAFFVDARFWQAFEDVPKDICDIYQSLNYKLLRAYGHPQDPRTVYEIFRRTSQQVCRSAPQGVE